MTIDGLADSEAVGAYYVGKSGGNCGGPKPSWGVTLSTETPPVPVPEPGTFLRFRGLSSWRAVPLHLAYANQAPADDGGREL
jgi:hypothetical protein